MVRDSCANPLPLPGLLPPAPPLEAWGRALRVAGGWWVQGGRGFPFLLASGTCSAQGRGEGEGQARLDLRARAHLPVCWGRGTWSRGWRLWQQAGAALPLETWGRRGVWSVGWRGRGRLGAPTYLLGAPTYPEAARACLLLTIHCFLLCALCVLCVEIVFPVLGFSLHA